jgi:putative nucleotidyltransferase with HDIG domain
MSTNSASSTLPAGLSLHEQIFARIGEVATLPTLAMQIFDIAADPNTDAEGLLRLVESDPALAARIVRTANSALYGMRRKVSDLLSCIMLVGFKEVRNLALTVFVSNLFRESPGYGTYNRLELWRHSVCAGAIARFLCKRMRHGPAEDAYLAGLLHDLGLILMDQYLHKSFCNVIDRLSEAKSTDDIERECLGFDHAQLGAAVAEKWRFPIALCDAIRYHHQPEHYAGEHRELVHCVAVANFVCHLKGVPSLGVVNGHRPPEHIFAALGFSADELASMWGDIDEIIAAASAAELV